jgi:hypothetical protein
LGIGGYLKGRRRGGLTDVGERAGGVGFGEVFFFGSFFGDVGGSLNDRMRGGVVANGEIVN